MGVAIRVPRCGTTRAGDPVRGPGAAAAFDAADPALLQAGRQAFAGFRLQLVARTPSTQELALRAARAGAVPGWCAVAEEQTAGRGRQGRTWSAPPRAALLVSMLVPALGIPGWPALAAGLAVIEAIDASVGSRRLELGVKWPNDVLAGGAAGGKLAGVLIETAVTRPGADGLVLGVGINVSVSAFPRGVSGASLHRLVDPDPPPRREALLAALLTTTARWWGELAAAGPAVVAAAWRERALGLDGRVLAQTPRGPVEGVARGLDGDGALLVETAHGLTRLLAGDVHLLAGLGRDSPV
ncbi:MAG TPA: biotin--[acetyl-CoA-carboxylase] ligase [Candidatus Dormibacteraeota bacterium]